MQKNIKNIKKIPFLGWVISDLLIAPPLFFYLFIHSIAIQNYLTHRVIDFLNQEYHIEIELKTVELGFWGSVRLHDLYLADQNQDSLAFVKYLELNLDIPSLVFKQKLYANSLELDGVEFYLKNTPENPVYNVNLLLEHVQSYLKVSEKKPTTSNTRTSFSLQFLHIKNSRFVFRDHRVLPSEDPIEMNYFDLDVKIDEIWLKNILFDGKKLNTEIVNISVTEKCGFFLYRFLGHLTLTNTFFEIQEATLLSTKTYYHGHIRFDYPGGFSDYLDFVNKVEMHYEVKDGYGYGEDIAHFVPLLKNLKEYAILHHGYVHGVTNNLKGEKLKISLKNQTYIEGQFLLKNIVDSVNSPYYWFELDTLTTTMQDVRAVSLYPNWDNQLNKNWLPSLTDSHEIHGTINAKYEEQNWKFTANLIHDLGTLTGYFDVLKDGETLSTQVKAKAWNLNDVGLPFVDHIELEVQGQYELKKEKIKADIEIFSLGLSSGIQLEHLGLKIRQTEKNLDLDLDARDAQHLTMAAQVQVKNYENFNIAFQIQRLNQQIFNPEFPIFWSSSGSIFLTGTELEKINSFAQIRSLKAIKKNKKYDFGTVKLQMNSNENYNTKFEFESSFLETLIQGKFRLSDWENYTNILLDQIIATKTNKKFSRKAEFNFQAQVLDTEPLFDLFDLAMAINKNSKISGIFNEKNEVFNVDLEIDHLQIEQNEFEKIQGYWEKKNQLNALDLKIKKLKLNAFAQHNLHFLAQSNNEQHLSGFFHWFSDLKNRGNLNFVLDWESQWTKMKLQFYDSDMVLEGKIWDLDPKALLWKKNNRWILEHFSLIHEQEKIILSGEISGEKPLRIQTENLYLPTYQTWISYFTERIFKGELSADLSFSSEDFMEKDNWIKGQLIFKNLEIDQQNIGNVSLQTSWLQNKHAFQMNGSIQQEDEKSIKISGFYYPFEKENIQFSLLFNRLNINFLASFLPLGLGISAFQAMVTGNIQISGNIEKPQLAGNLSVNEGRFYLKTTNLLYQFQGNLLLKEDQLWLKNIQLLDPEKNKIALNGKIDFTDLNDIVIENEIKSERFLFLNTTQKQNPVYFGQLYAGTQLILKYDKGILALTGDVRVYQQSKFSMYLIDEYNEKGANFVKFSKKNTSIERENNFDKENGTSPENTRYDVQLNIEIEPNTKVDLSLDNKNANLIKAKIAGDLGFKYTLNQQTLLNGQVNILEGDYTFDLQSIISRKFTLQPLGNIRWNGPIEEGKLNVKANYSVRASVKTLVENQQDSPLYRLGTEEFYCSVIIGDKITAPSFKTQVSFASTAMDEQVLSEFRRLLASENEMTAQFGSLLILGQFLPKSTANALVSGLSNTGINRGAQLITGPLSNFMSSFFNEQIDFSLKYNRSTSGDQQVEFGIEAPIVKDRLIFKGTTGVSQQRRELSSDVNMNLTSVKDVSNLIGNFDLEYKVTKDGNFSLKLFNQMSEQNSVASPGQDHGKYTQGVGLRYKEDFNTLNETKAVTGIKSIFKKKQKKQNSSNNLETEDTENTEENSQENLDKNLDENSQENIEKSEDIEKSENTEKSEDTEKSEKSENTEKSEKSENTENTENIENIEKSEDTENTKNTEDTEKSEDIQKRKKAKKRKKEEK